MGYTVYCQPYACTRTCIYEDFCIKQVSRIWTHNYISQLFYIHDDVIKWKHFPRYWPSVRGIHRSPVNSPHKGQWRGALMFTLICARINGWVNNREAGDLRRYRSHYDVIVMRKVLCFRNIVYHHFNLQLLTSLSLFWPYIEPKYLQWQPRFNV